MEKNLTALDLYINRVFKLLIYGIPVIGLFAGFTYTCLKLFGYYENVSFLSIIIFDIINVLYVVSSLIICGNAFNHDHQLKHKFVLIGKIFILLVEICQWNYISYMFPSSDFWAYAVFFVMLSILFLDHKYTLLISLVISCSLLLSWIIKKPELLPTIDSFYYPNLVLRGVLLVLSFSAIWGSTYVIQNILVKELENIADHDGLTSLYSRRVLDVKMSNYINLYNRKQNCFSVIMFDIDDFKETNDKYGHDCGDAVLKYVSNAIKYDIPEKTGTIFRYGGEEFLAVINKDLSEATEIAETLRSTIELSDIPYNDLIVKITVTAGVATYKTGLTKEDIIKLSDDRLYFGKTHGKNMVVNK